LLAPKRRSEFGALALLDPEPEDVLQGAGRGEWDVLYRPTTPALRRRRRVT